MSTWKSAERAICKMLGATRVPITGRQRGDAPDGKHGFLSIEIKHREELPQWLHNAMDQAIKASRDDRLPVVILHELRQLYKHSYVVFRLGDINKALTEEEIEHD